ncbi:MAG: DUF1176 domain-containing protein [Desulfovibrionaceae bacterium]
MIRAATGLLLCLLALLPAVPWARAAGIDCAKATTNVEKLLCADPALQTADAAVAEAFATARDAASDPAAVRASQRDWLKVRNACPDAACLATVQAERQAALAALTAEALRQHAAKRARLRNLLGWPEDCEQSFQELLSPDGRGATTLGTGVESHPLGDGRTLYCVQCDLAAYQATYVIMLQEKPEGPGTLLRFPLYDRDGAKIVRSEDTFLAGALDFTPRTGELTVFTKARGIGDCGSYVRYAFPATGPKRVTVVEARVKGCSDRPPMETVIDPGTWPLVKN